MKKGFSYFGFILCYMLAGHGVFAQNTWIKKNNAPVSGIAFVINNMGYEGGTPGSPNFWQYDPSTDTWSQKADLDSARYNSVGFAVNGKGYIGSGVSGNDGTIMQDLWQYDPVANTWSQRKNMPGTGPRWGAIAVVVNNKAYFGFGDYQQVNGAILSQDFWVYNDTTDTWTALANFPSTGRLNPVAFCLDSNGIGVANTIYVGTGWDGNNYDNDFWAYNINTNSWEQKQSLPGPGRFAASAFAVQDRGYIGLGGNTANVVDSNASSTGYEDFYEYSPANNQWTSIPNYPVGKLLYASSFVIGNYGYVMCGINYGGFLTTDVYAWGPVITDTVTTTICIGQSYGGHTTSGTFIDTFQLSNGNDSIRTLNLTVNGQNGWIKKSNFPVDSFGGQAYFIINNKGYEGGVKNGSPNFWEYDPATDSWTQKADFPKIRVLGVGFAVNGKGYIGSGVIGFNGILQNDLWEYDPVANTWTQKNNMPGNPRWNAIALVANNKAYFGFGDFAQLNGAVLATDFWVYNDTTDSWTALANFPSTGRLAPAGFSLDSNGIGLPNTIYVGTGWDGTNYHNDFWAYNIGKNSWEQKQNFPGTGRTNGTGFAIQNQGYMGLGGQIYTSDYSDIYKYNPINNQWIAIPNYPAGGLTAVNTFVIGDYAYLFGGGTFSNIQSSQVYAWGPIPISDTITTTICNGQSYSGHTTSGTYTDTFTSYTGCDSLRTLNLTVLPAPRDTITQTICFGQNYEGHTVSGTYIDTLAATGGCDSIRILNLKVLNEDRISDSVIICEGQTYNGRNKTGKYSDTLVALNGCDSIYNLNLTVLPVFHNVIAQTVCAGQSYEGHTTSGTYIDTLTSYTGCDSIRTLNLTVLPAVQNTVSQTICAGQTFEGHNAAGVYADTFSTANGCDSISVLNLTVNGQDVWIKKSNFSGPARQDGMGFTINNKGYIGGGNHVSSACYNDFWEYDPLTDSWSQKANIGGGPRGYGVGFAVNGKGYIGSGITSLNGTGTNLQDLWQYDPAANTWTQKNNMPGTNPSWGGRVVIANNRAYFGFGDYGQLNNPILINGFWAYNDTADTWTALANFPAGGRVGPVMFSPDSNGISNTIYAGSGWTGISGTSGTNDIWAYNISSNSWVQKQNFPGTIRLGANSFALLNTGYMGLGGQANTDSFFNDFYSYNPINDSWTQIANFPYVPLKDAITFVIGNNAYLACGNNSSNNNEVYAWGPIPISDTITTTICLGQSYSGHSASGTYIDTLTSYTGCDSIRTLYLTVLPAQSDTITQTICAGQSYAGHTIAGLYADTFITTNGCDSISVLDLVILHADKINETVTICEGQSYRGYNATGIYTDSLYAANGCDSIYNLNLTVLPVIHDVVSQTICYGQSYEGHTLSGEYADSAVSAGGCDSFHTLYLTILPEIIDTVIKGICTGQTYGGHDTSGIFIDTLTSANGCDSIRLLTLTVADHNFFNIIKATICAGDTFSGYTVSGIYHDTTHSITGCDTIILLELNVVPRPDTPIIIQYGDTLLSSAALKYQWYFENIALDGDTNQKLAITHGGAYTIQVWDSSACSASSIIVDAYLTGIEANQSPENNITLFPNPNNGQFTIGFAKPIAGLTELSLQDVTGRIIWQQSMADIAAGNIPVDAGQLSKGIYIFMVRSANMQITKKLAVE